LERAKALGPVLGLIGWTLFVWGGRIRNVAADNQLQGWARNWRMAIAVVFVAAALGLAALTVGWLLGPDNRIPRRLAQSSLGLAVIGSGWWAVRGLDIALGDHALGFKVVHSVLAVVTIGLGLAVVGWTQKNARAQVGPSPR
jgi:hypothetical protein